MPILHIRSSAKPIEPILRLRALLHALLVQGMLLKLVIRAV
jgi:hypothetical protein